jgi:hypothetical protein
MKQLNDLTLKWAGDRGLLLNGTVISQALKLGSEVGELCYNLGNNNPIKDDIGDCLVVCTILSNLQGSDLIEIMEDVSPITHKTPLVPTLVYYLGELQDKALKGLDITIEIRNIVNQLDGICTTRHTTLREGWTVAYDDIKDREGFLTKEGVFVKSTDENYDAIVAREMEK